MFFRFVSLIVLGACAAAAPTDHAPQVTRAPPQVVTPPPHATTTCPKAARAPNDPVAVVFRADRFLSHFWIVDSMSQWSDSTTPVYARFFKKRSPNDAAGDELLAAYARVRRAHSKDADVTPDIAHPDSVMPDTLDAAGHYARAFLCAASAYDAAAALALDADETKTIVATFEHFASAIDAVLDESTYLAKAADEFRSLAKRASMDAFLGRMLRFFGSDGEVSTPFYVDVVWAPPDNHQATTVDDQMVIPVTRAIADDHAELASWLGVTVHEFGHSFLGSLPATERARLSDRIIGTLGITRQRHANLIDEATQAALGNIIFVQQRLPEYYDDSGIYSYEPRVDYPDAIDSLARAVAPLVLVHLDEAHGFEGPYLKSALDAQARSIPPLLAHHAHTALLLFGNPSAGREFRGLFWGRSRFETSMDDVARFVELSKKGPDITRWIVATLGDLTPQPALATDAGMPAIDALKKRLASSKDEGCIAAKRRMSGLGYDIVVLARDHDALRHTLIGISRGMPIPEVVPRCQ